MKPVHAQLLLAAVAAVVGSCALVAPAVAFPTGGGANFDKRPIVPVAATGHARAIQGVNIRTGGGPAFPVVGVLRGGEVVGLAECSPYWCRLADGRGWVARQFLAIGAEPAAIIVYDDAPPALPPPRFTGAWTVVSTPVPPPPEAWATTVRQLYGTPKPPPPVPPFALFVAQAGETVEGIGKGIRLAGRVQPGGGEALVTITTADGKRLAGRIAVEGGVLTAVVEDEDGATELWRATRTILTR